MFGAPDYPLPQALSVSGPDNAWVSGTAYQSLLAEHWDGTQWTSVTPPPSVDNLANATVNDAVMGSSSPTNTWFFPQVSGPDQDQDARAGLERLSLAGGHGARH